MKLETQNSKLETQNSKLETPMHLHLVGIGGSGMSAIARVLLGRGFVVSGSDKQLNELTAALQTLGATIYQGHQADHIAGAEAVVISSAVSDDNPEVEAAQDAGIPILKRADLLGQLMEGMIGVAVAGSHGKTTTTGMVAQILLEADLDPTVVVGGVLPSLGGNGRFGAGDYFVVEADEYDHMFLGLKPEVIVLTNLEHDHPDIFPTPQAYEAAFYRFLCLLPAGGKLITCADDPGVVKLLNRLHLPDVEITTYSIPTQGEPRLPIQFQALDIRPNQLGGSDFVVEEEDQMLGVIQLRLPGWHNVRNALAATIVGLDLGVDFQVIRQALARFDGMERRFQVVGETGGVTVIDDYAHHPTEIQATLAAARQRYPNRCLWAVWQPHTYSRTKLLLSAFAASFQQADRVIGLDIYKSREVETLGMNTAVVMAAMKHPNAIHIPDLLGAASYILEHIGRDDVVLTLSAGDGNQVGKLVLDGLRIRGIR